MNLSSSFLVQLTENDKRFIIALVFVIIFVIALGVYLCLLIEKISKYQGKKIDKLMHDVVVTGVIKDSKQFNKVAKYKNRVQFYKDTKIPMLMFVLSIIIAVIYMGVHNDWNFAALFSDYGSYNSATNTYEGGKGFATLLYLWDYSKIPTSNFFGLNIVSGWAPLLQTPHFEVTAITSYIFAPLFVVSIILFAFNVQRYMARSYRIFKLADSIYDKSLDNVKFDNLSDFKVKNGLVTYKDDETNLQEINKKDDGSQSEPSSNNLENKDSNNN